MSESKSEKLIYNIEVFPGKNGGDSGPSKAACPQRCAHCPSAARDPIPERFDDEAQVVLSSRMLDVLTRVSKIIRRESGSQRSQPSILNHFNFVLPTLASVGPFELPLAPRVFSLILGDLSRLRPDNFSRLPQIADSIARFQSGRQPVLNVDHRLSGSPESISEEDLARVPQIWGPFLDLASSPSPSFTPRQICLTESFNAHFAPDFDENAYGRMLNRFANILASGLMRVFNIDATESLFPDLDLRLNDENTFKFTSHEGRVFDLRRLLKSRGFSPDLFDLSSHVGWGDFLLTYHKRVLRRSVSHHTSLLKASEISFSFFPDYIWVNHSTRHVADETVRFTYEQFGALLQEAESKQLILNHVVYHEIISRRRISILSRDL